MTEHELREMLVAQMRRGLRLPDVARRLEVDPVVIEAFLNGAQMTDAAMAALPKILANGHTGAHSVAKSNKPMGTNLKAKAIKVTVVLDPKEVAALPDPNPKPRVTLRIQVAGRVVSADVAAKSLRRAKLAINQHGTDGVICFVQGRLESGDVVAEAGIAAQPKAAKAGDSDERGNTIKQENTA